MSMSPEELEQRRVAANPPKPPQAELLETGEEEVFSRTEVESGRIEHGAKSGAHTRAPDGRTAEEVLRDEEQTVRQAPEDAGPGEAAGS